MATQQQLIPFENATYPKHNRIGTIDLKEGQKANPLELPRVGWLRKLHCVLRLDFNIGADGVNTWKEDGVLSLIDRIIVKSNLGSVEVVDLAGYDLALMNKYIEKSYDLKSSTPTLVKGAGGAGNNKIEYYFQIPITLNDHLDTAFGLINCQSLGTILQLETRFGRLTDAINSDPEDMTFNSATLEIAYDFYEMPPANMPVRAPERVFIRRWSQEQTVLTTGDNYVNVPEQGHLFNLMQVLRVDGVRSSAIDTVSLMVNKTDRIWEEAYIVNRERARQHLGFDLPNGVIMRDLMHSLGQISAGGTREVIDVGGLGEFDSIIRVRSGTTLGVNPSSNKITSIYQMIVPVQVLTGGN